MAFLIPVPPGLHFLSLRVQLETNIKSLRGEAKRRINTKNMEKGRK
jgi:hypothetical protein